MKKLMTLMLGLSFLTGLATVSFAKPDEPKKEEKKPKKAKSSKPKKDKKKAEDTK